MSEFIFVRHGRSQANAEGVIADSQSPLVEEGLERARKTAAEVAGFGITKIVCSPYLRAQQTAATIASELGIDLAHIEVVEELHERGLGELEGKPKSQESEWYFAAEEGFGIEPQAELVARMQTCLGKIRETASDGLVLAVGHAVSGFYLQQIAQGKTSYAEFDPPSQMNNADFVRVKL